MAANRSVADESRVSRWKAVNPPTGLSNIPRSIRLGHGDCRIAGKIPMGYCHESNPRQRSKARITVWYGVPSVITALVRESRNPKKLHHDDMKRDVGIYGGDRLGRSWTILAHMRRCLWTRFQRGPVDGVRVVLCDGREEKQAAKASVRENRGLRFPNKSGRFSRLFTGTTSTQLVSPGTLLSYPQQLELSGRNLAGHSDDCYICKYVANRN